MKDLLREDKFLPLDKLLDDYQKTRTRQFALNKFKNKIKEHRLEWLNEVYQFIGLKQYIKSKKPKPNKPTTTW